MNRRQKRSSGGYGLRKKAVEKKLDDDFEYYLSKKIRRVLLNPAPKSVKLARTAQVLTSTAKYLEKQTQSASEDEQPEESKKESTRKKKSSSSKQVATAKKGPVGRPPKKSGALLEGSRTEKKAEPKDELKTHKEAERTPVTLTQKRGRGRPPKLKPNIQYEVVDYMLSESKDDESSKGQFEGDVANSGVTLKTEDTSQDKKTEILVIDETSIKVRAKSTRDDSDETLNDVGEKVDELKRVNDPLDIGETEEKESRKRERKGKTVKNSKKSKVKIPEYTLNENDKIECEECHKLLKPSSYRQHLRTHTGLKPFSCNMCEARFTRKGDVERHVKIVHHKEKPFKCCRCPRAFGDKKNLRWHLTNHDRKLFYACEVCGFKFGKREYWENHVKFIHPIPMSGEGRDDADHSGESFESTMRVVEQGMVETDDGEMEESGMVEMTGNMQVMEETVIEELNNMEQQSVGRDTVPVQQLNEVQGNVGGAGVSRTMYITEEQAEGASEGMREAVLIPAMTHISNGQGNIGSGGVAEAVLISGVASLAEERGDTGGGEITEAMFIPSLTQTEEEQIRLGDAGECVVHTEADKSDTVSVASHQKVSQSSGEAGAPSREAENTDDCSNKMVVSDQVPDAVNDECKGAEEKEGSHAQEVSFQASKEESGHAANGSQQGGVMEVTSGDPASQKVVSDEHKGTDQSGSTNEEINSYAALAPDQQKNTEVIAASEADIEGPSSIPEVKREVETVSTSKQESAKIQAGMSDVILKKEGDMMHALVHVGDRVQEVTFEPEPNVEEEDTQTFEIETPGVTEEVVSDIIPAVTQFAKGQNIIVINQESLHQIQSQQSPKVISITLNGGGGQDAASNVVEVNPSECASQGKVINITVKGGDLVDGVENAENSSHDAVQTLIDAVQELLDTAKDDGDQVAASGETAATRDSAQPEKT